MDLKFIDLIYHKPNFLTKEECDFLIAESDRRASEYSLEHCPEAVSGIDTYSTYQKVELFIGTEGQQIVHKATEKLINEYHDYLDSLNAFHTLFRENLLYSHMYRLLKYETGAQIHPHTDHDPYTYGSCTFNLNDNYSGGEFAWFRDRYRLKLGRGDGLIFPADFFWVHEVKPITEGVRYSTNSFLLSIPDIMKWEASELVKKLKENPPDHPMFQNQLSQKYNINPRKDTSNEKNSNGTGFSNCNADICANCQDCGTKES